MSGPALWLPKSALRPARARLRMLGTKAEAWDGWTPAFDLPAHWWWHLAGWAVPLPTDDKAELAAALAAFTQVAGPAARRMILETPAGDFGIGAVDMQAGTVWPAEARPFVEWLVPREKFHAEGWHLARQLRMLHRPSRRTGADAMAFAWEVLNVANALALTVYGEPSGYLRLNLGEAVARNWPRKRREKELLAREAERARMSADEMVLQVAAGAALEAAHDLRVNDRFKVRGELKHTDTMLLPEFARAFLSRAIRSARATIGYDRKKAPAVEPKTPADPLDQLAARERIDRLYTAAADDLDHRLLDALGEGANLAEAAHTLGVKHATARKRLSRLKKRLL